MRCAADVELDLSLGVGDDRPQRDLAAGAGGGWHRDHRRDARPYGAVPPLVLDDAAVVRGDDTDPLRGVHRAAAADGDEPVAALLAVFGSPFVDQLHAGIGADLVEHDRLDVALAQRFQRGVQQAGGLDAGVGDKKRSPHAELRRLVA